jgi:hypothetical protein
MPQRRMMMARRRETAVAAYTVTTTGAATHTINSFGVSASTVVDWGDGSQDTYTGTAQRTHNYAGAGTWTVTIRTPENVTTFDIRDNKVNLSSANIATMSNVVTAIFIGLRSGRFDSADVSAWQPFDFRLYSMPAGYAGTFNSADVAAWRPANFFLLAMPAGYTGTFNSADVAAWRPGTFYLYNMPAGYTGTFNSADVSAWRPTAFVVYSMPAGYAGTFNSADVAAWRPANFFLLAMPAGYTGTFNSADVAAWRPGDFRLYSMPAGYAITISATGFTQWTTTNSFEMQSNNLLQAAVNSILWQLYQASIAPRTATGGTINVGGTNQAPSGTFQAATSCPATVATPGKEIRHELLNDGCGASFNKWTTVTVA